ncbi:MAG: hypothetical protein LBF88_05350 [Planctomycetaceae bacterium]|jgi:hypothetical protein|nr:hypothetical protein [Planctomycetaceae bacterium]
MARFHPFKSFQQNRKKWLAVLGILTMISFIILPVFMGWYPSSGRTGPAKLASCRRYGSIDEQNVDVLVQNRNDLGRFYLVLYRQLADPNNQERMIALRSLERTASEYDQILEPEELVNNWLLTQYAKELGMSIDKTNIINYLTLLTGGSLTNTVYQSTLKAVGMTEQRFEYLITLELLYVRMREMFEIGLNVIPPSTRWEWFQRLNRQITAEVAAVPVEQFIDQIAEPTNAQLQNFFDENKNKPFNPTQIESGFTIPDKIAFQYVKAVPDQKVLDSIAEEEIKQYYEENKETLFRRPVQPIETSPMFPTLPSQGGNLFQSGNLGGFTPSSRPFPTPQLPITTTPLATPQQPEQVPADNTDKTDTDKKEEPPKTETTPAVNENEPEKKESEKTEPSNSEPPKPESSVPESEKNELEKSSFLVPVKTRFVSYQTEAETEKNTNPVSNSEQPKTKESKTEQPKTEELKTNDVPNVPLVPIVPLQPEQPKTEESKTEESKTEKPVDLSILYRPLDEVKDQIRLTLATEKVMKSLPFIEEKMRDYFQVYYTHLDQEKTAPPMPDLTAFVEEQGLVLKTVPLDTIFGLIKSEFARSVAGREYLFNLFNEAPIVFEPKKMDSENILLWVTEIQSENKPEKLEEIKEIVLKRWKELEARPLARKRAEELAMEVRRAEKSLEETFSARSDVPVTETEPFTYKSYGASMYAAFLAMRGIPPRLGEVCEKGVAVGDSEIDNKWIVAPGVEFMETALSLAVGETGVVFNQPQTVAYVIRITSSSPSEEVLWGRFQNASIMEYYLAGQPETIADARKAWLNKIYEEVGFKWIQKPERLRRQR